MKRSFLAVAAALALAGPMLVYAAPDEAQKQLLQRSQEARRKLDAAQNMQGPQRDKLMQEHMALILRGWAGIEKASSHSGRRSVITDIIHKQKKSLKVAQKVAGHKSASTTVIYDEPPEEAISDALKNLS